jgi:hypothetical protein
MSFIIKALAANDDVNTDNLGLQLVGGASDIQGLITAVLPWVSLAAGVIAFAYLIYSGFLYLSAGGNAESAKKGQQGILNAIIGLIIIALAYTITTALVGTFNNTTS